MIKIGTQNREISQVLSQVLEYFFCRLYLPSFPISVANKVSWSCIKEFLAVGICEIQSKSVSSANKTWFERCHQNCDWRDSYCHDTYCSAIHHLPPAKCHGMWRKTWEKFVKLNKTHAAFLSFLVVLTFSICSSCDFRAKVAVQTMFRAFRNGVRIPIQKTY